MFNVSSFLIIFPSFIKIVLLVYSKISSKLWLTIIIVVPSFDKVSKRSNISLAPWGSNPAVGSSKTKILGFIAIIPAIATLRFCPPDNSNGFLSKNDSSRPTFTITSFAIFLASSFDIPIFIGPKIISFSIVSSNNWYSANWKTIPTNFLISFIFLIFLQDFFITLVFSCSSIWLVFLFLVCTKYSNSIEPFSGINKQLRCSIKVVLPLPVGPIIPINSFWSIWKETFETASIFLLIFKSKEWLIFISFIFINSPKIHQYHK